MLKLSNHNHRNKSYERANKIVLYNKIAYFKNAKSRVESDTFFQKEPPKLKFVFLFGRALKLSAKNKFKEILHYTSVGKTKAAHRNSDNDL